MTCATCADRGLVTVNWADAEPEYAVCLCDVGHMMRVTRNATRATKYAMWELWVARAGINPARVVKLEDVLTSEELRERGFGLETPAAPLDAVAAAARAKAHKVKL